MAHFLLKKRRLKERRSGDLSNNLTTVTDPAGAASEAYRTLRTNLLYTLVDTPPKVVVVTSSGPMEGKSTTCANLGVVLAQADKKTLVVDCDFRRPIIHKIFGLRNIQGIANVLFDERRLEKVWQEPLLGLKVVTVGSIPPNPAELLGSQRFSELLASVREQFDYVLIDTPPIGLVSDPTILATQGDGVLLVLDAQKTRKAHVRQSMRSLENVGAKVLGTVMNNAKTFKGGYDYYSYSYRQS